MSAKEPGPTEIIHSELFAPALQERAARISIYHQSFEKAAQDQLGYAFLCGVELTQAKAQLKGEQGHGQFVKWREAALPQISQPTTSRYMQFAKAIAEQSKQIASLTAKPLQLTNGELPEEDRKIILKAVHDFADGATLTELYRDLNILRKPKHQSERAPGKPMTPAEKAAAEEKLALEHAHTWLDDGALLNKHEPLSRLPVEVINEMADFCIEFGKTLAPLRRAKKNKERGLQPASTHRSPK